MPLTVAPLMFFIAAKRQLSVASGYHFGGGRNCGHRHESPLSPDYSTIDPAEILLAFAI